VAGVAANSLGWAAVHDSGWGQRLGALGEETATQGSAAALVDTRCDSEERTEREGGRARAVGGTTPGPTTYRPPRSATGPGATSVGLE